MSASSSRHNEDARRATRDEILAIICAIGMPHKEGRSHPEWDAWVEKSDALEILMGIQRVYADEYAQAAAGTYVAKP